MIAINTISDRMDLGDLKSHRASLVLPKPSSNNEARVEPNSRRQVALLTAMTIGLAAILLVAVAYRWNLLLGRKAELILAGVVESQETRLGSKIGGRVAEVYVSEGEIVESGQILVRLDVPELNSQLTQLEAVKAIAESKLELAKNGPLPEQIEAAEADLESAESQLAELKAGYRTEEIAQALLDVSVRQTEESRAKKELDRMTQLKSSNSVSRSEVDSTTAVWENAAGQVAMAKQRLKLLEAGPRVETISGAQARVRRATADLNLLRRGTRYEELKQLESQIQEINGRICELQTNIAESKIVASAKCMVEVIPVRRGDIAQANQSVIRVRTLGDLWIKAYVPETDLGKLRLNQRVDITHDGSVSPVPGTIVHIASTSEFTPRNVQSISERQHQVFGVKVRPEDSDGVFKSGMAAQVRLKLKDN